MLQYGKINTSSTYVNWVQPTLTSNGSYGVDNFAVKASAVYSTHYCYYAFDNNSGNHYCANGTANPIIYMYSKNKLKISKITFTGYSSGSHQFTWSGATLYGSNDDNTWTQLGSNTSPGSSSTTPWSITVTNSTPFNYFKIQTNAGSNATAMNQIDITAQYLTTQLNSITFPMSFSNTYYGFSHCYVGGIENSSYLTSKTTSSIGLSGVTGTASSAYWIACGY